MEMQKAENFQNNFEKEQQTQRTHTAWSWNISQSYNNQGGVALSSR